MTVPYIRTLGAGAEGFAGIAAVLGVTVVLSLIRGKVLRGATGRRA